MYIFILLLLCISCCSPLGSIATYAASREKITVFIGSPAGSNTDLLGRKVLQGLGEKTGGTFIVINRPGATGIIANETVARAQPDGRTLLLAPWSSITINPHMRLKMPYDSLKDLVPVVQVARFGYTLVSHPGVPVHSIRDIITLGRARPGSITFGSTGIGSGYHLAAELFGSMARVKILHIPYGGGNTPVLMSILSGQIDLMFAGAAVIEPFVKNGKLRVIAVTGLARNPIFPNVPTINESGLPGYEIVGWIGLFAPRGTPAPLVYDLNARVHEVFAAPEMLALWKSQDTQFYPNKPEEFAETVKNSYERLGALIRRIGIRPE